MFSLLLKVQNIILDSVKGKYMQESLQQGSNQDKHQKVLLTMVTRLLLLCLQRS